MAAFTYRGIPIRDENGIVIAVRPVRGIVADDGLTYPGVLGRDAAGNAFTYNQYPDTGITPPAYEVFITSENLDFVTANNETFMVGGQADTFNSTHAGAVIDAGISAIFNIQAEIIAKKATLDNLIVRIRSLEG